MNEQLETETILSQEKLEEIHKELEYLETTRRTEIAKSLEYARSLGDLSENAEYQEARELQASVEERIRRLTDIIKNAKVMESTNKKDVVGFGSVVSICREGEQETHAYTIVGSEEADMRERKLSHLSPLGSAIMGKKKNEVFTFETPNGKQTYVVKKIS
ncbi:MAG TPA: transcription elongation factor GreA [Candidatus Kaiserbacteria bacterium]|nr:transcription elongation factor GreA [Candidatus Kaiserbacteria bacterium]